jgi:hypothetical protein
MAKTTLRKLNPIRVAIDLYKWAIVSTAWKELDAEIADACGKSSGLPRFKAIDVEFGPADK